MTPYIIVTGNGTRELQKHVNDAINNGYRPTGGPFRIGSGGEYGCDWYGQAMIYGG